MKRIMLLVVLLPLAGCGSLGTRFSWETFRAQERTIVAQNKSDQAYWEALGESYRPSGQPGTVDSAGIKSPGYYQNGVLINRAWQMVTFVITGQKSLTRTVPIGSTAKVSLPPGMYRVEIYYSRSTTPYRQADLPVDAERGDCDIDGQVCDFFMIAP
ncbi:MAG: hypothetical protein PHW95_01910 [Patescibacteria group bacterium]|nr:hypothetical protein [Patescibacteria group bacterium]